VRFTVVTILPELIESPLAAGVVGRARQAGTLTVDAVNPRDFTHDRHRTVDDTPYGGGPGMVMKCEPLVAAIEQATAGSPGARRILLAPTGAPLTQAKVRELATHPHLVLVCGRYEGVDERVIETSIDEEISLGDFVLSGGELGALVVIDAVARLIPGVLGEPASADEESFSAGLLEYPQYTRPVEFRGLRVPEVLASGNHALIRRWRRTRSLERTALRRPDLVAGVRFSDEDRKQVAGLPALDVARRTYVALVHHPVLDRTGKVITTALTNFDVHDIARSTATYDLGAYYIVTPVTSQRDKAAHIASLWQEESGHTRADALALVRPVAAIADVVADLTERHGIPPRIVATSARPDVFPGARHLDCASLVAELRTEPGRPMLVLFGTGWGLAHKLIPEVERVLAPIEGRPPWNHLSVRSAVAITLDRLFGLREGAVPGTGGR
jgi:tRNA (guanine37-N1)-methyltransferase